MTNDNAVGGTLVAASERNLKQTLRKESLEEATLIHEEEKMMEDEEVTSVESNEDHEEDTERTLLTVALMKSVVDQQQADPSYRGLAAGRASVSNGCKQPMVETTGEGSDSIKRRLRKRRRRCGQDLARLERFQSTKEGGLAYAASKPASPLPQKKLESQTSNSTKAPSNTIASLVPNPLLPFKSDDMRLAPPLSRSAVLPSNNLVKKSKEANIKANEVCLDAVSLVSSFAVPCPLLPAEVSFAPSSDASATLMSDPVRLIEDSKRKVNFDQSMPRMRGFSIDSDYLELWGGDASIPGDGTSGVNDDEATTRSRSYSFECFAFGINEDEPLPPLEQSSSSDVRTIGRPRGDSIIFDPASFQDGGILEQRALEEVITVQSKPLNLPKAQSVAAISSSSRKVCTTKPKTTTSTKASMIRKATSDPTSVTTHSSVNAGLTVDTFSTSQSLELVNKGGRIGIYLPEARRARLARFHAKRSRRIWRKRIKYDCRKKLADSRPRVKGRFVKRLEE